jgi:hypothetical protein
MGLFRSDDYPVDPRTRQFMDRGRQIETIAFAAMVSAAVTTAIGLSVLWFLAPPRSVDVRPTIVEPRRGCRANCVGTVARLDAHLIQEALPSADRPISVAPARVISRANDAATQINLVTSAFADAAKISDTENKAIPSDAEALSAVRELASADQAATQTMPIPEPTRLLPAPRPTPTDETRRFFERGRGFIGQGDITTARLFFERAADRGDGSAVFALAETYDPAVLARWNAHNVSADPDRARALYEQAWASGLTAAKERMDRLGAPAAHP